MQRPRPSNRPTEQSRRSLMLVENDERIKILPMSSVIDSSRLLKTSMAMGSMTRPLPVASSFSIWANLGSPVLKDVDHDIADAIDPR